VVALLPHNPRYPLNGRPRRAPESVWTPRWKENFPFSQVIKARFHHVPALGLVNSPSHAAVALLPHKPRYPLNRRPRGAPESVWTPRWKENFPFSPGIKARFHHVPALGLVNSPSHAAVALLPHNPRYPLNGRPRGPPKSVWTPHWKENFPFSPGIKARFHHVPALGLVNSPTATTIVPTCRAINSRDM